jgi:hypothetical protein
MSGRADRRRGASLAASVALLSFLSPTLARAEGNGDPIEACVSAASEGQKLQRAGKLRDARATFLSCMKPECPAEVKHVCDRFLTSVEASLPTVILGATDGAGQDLFSVRVVIDGALTTESLDGKAMPIDPGPHVVRFERAGGAPTELRVLIREGEKNRALAVSFPPDKRAHSPEPLAERAPAPVGAYVVGGVGVLALGAFTVLAIHGQGRYDDCRAHGCTSGATDSLSVERGFAFGTLAVGVVALGIATWLFLDHPAPKTSAQR